MFGVIRLCEQPTNFNVVHQFDIFIHEITPTVIQKYSLCWIVAILVIIEKYFNDYYPCSIVVAYAQEFPLLPDTASKCRRK